MKRHKPRLRHARRRVNAIGIERVIAATPQLAIMDTSLRERGYVVASGRLYPCKDGTYTARVVWRCRAEGMTFSGSVQGLVLRP